MKKELAEQWKNWHGEAFKDHPEMKMITMSHSVLGFLSIAGEELESGLYEDGKSVLKDNYCPDCEVVKSIDKAMGKYLKVKDGFDQPDKNGVLSASIQTSPGSREKARLLVQWVLTNDKNFLTGFYSAIEKEWPDIDAKSIPEEIAILVKLACSCWRALIVDRVSRGIKFNKEGVHELTAEWLRKVMETFFAFKLEWTKPEEKK